MSELEAIVGSDRMLRARRRSAEATKATSPGQKSSSLPENEKQQISQVRQDQPAGGTGQGGLKRQCRRLQALKATKAPLTLKQHR